MLSAVLPRVFAVAKSSFSGRFSGFGSNDQKYAASVPNSCLNSSARRALLMVDSILRPLQTFATHSSTFALQTLGVEAYRVGNKINLDHMELGVIDQCSGLRMLTIFIALATAIAMIFTHRPMWERLVLVASAVPIAILVNVIRITITGVLYNLKVDSEIANHIFHNWAGYIMMPMALGLLFLVMQVLSQLVVETSQLPPTSRNVSHVSGVQRPLGANPVGRSGKTV